MAEAQAIGENGGLPAGIVLAGGLSRRMGNHEKALLELSGKPMIARVCARLKPQLSVLAINANGDPGRFAFLDLPVLGDGVPGNAGPLAGVLAGLDWLAAGAHTPSLAVDVLFTAATDTPFLPADIVARLLDAWRDAGSSDDTIAMAVSPVRRHTVCALWPLALRDALHTYLCVEGGRKVVDFAHRFNLLEVAFEASGGIDPFFNINTPDDLAGAEGLL